MHGLDAHRYRTGIALTTGALVILAIVFAAVGAGWWPLVVAAAILLVAPIVSMGPDLIRYMRVRAM
jgi:hypothetical protein